VTNVWDPPTGPIPVQRPGGSRTAWAVALAAVAALLAVLAFWARSEAADRSAEADRLNQSAARAAAEAKQLTADTGNEALGDVELTREVTGYLTGAIEATFSYDYTNLAKTEQAADAHLTDNARCEYDELFGEVEQYATQQKIVLTTTVRELALVQLNSDDAEALVYIDQLSTRVDVNKTVAVGGQFAVQAHREGNQWKITEFDMFGQPLFNGKPSPTC
jgi:Mce-associated membrane protein